jgi:L-lysine 2,3-aminomutase
MREAKTEEEPPGPGRPSYHRENVPPTPRCSQHWQLSHCLNAAGEFAWVSCLTSEKAVDLSAPRLFLADVSSYFVHLVHPENSAFPIEWQVAFTFHKAIYSETYSCTSIPWHKPEGNNGR